MHTALNRLIEKKVKNPEIVGLLLEDCNAVAYKMTLGYDGQYKMTEISRFNFTRRENVDDILLIQNSTESRISLIVPLPASTVASVVMKSLLI